MQCEYGLNAAACVLLITARQIPDQGLAFERLEHLAVTLAHLLSGQAATQRIFNVRVRPGLVQNEVATLQVGNGVCQPDFKLAASTVLAITKMTAKGVVLHIVDIFLSNDVGGAVAIVLVNVQNAHLDVACVMQGRSRHHETIESTKPLCRLKAGMVKARGGRAAVRIALQSKLRGIQQRTAGVEQGGRHGRRAIAKPVVYFSRQNALHILGMMGTVKVFQAHWPR